MRLGHDRGDLEAVLSEAGGAAGVVSRGGCPWGLGCHSDVNAGREKGF